MNEEFRELIEEIGEWLKGLENKYNSKEEWPKEGDYYWIIDDLGLFVRHCWRGSLFDKKMFKVGNIFKTEEEAEHTLEKLKVIQELKQMAGPFRTGRNNYLIQYDSMHDRLISVLYTERVVAYGNFYFYDEAELYKAIDRIGEGRIKKYLFGVE